MDYLADLQILRDVYYRLSEKRIFFEYEYSRTLEEENRHLIEEYIKNYCKKYGVLDKYNYLVDHIMLLKIALRQGRAIQQEEVNGTLGLNDNDRALKDALENWDKRKNDDWHREWITRNWEELWGKSTNKERFIQEYGQEYIDEIIEEVEKIEVLNYIEIKKKRELIQKQERDKRIEEYEKSKQVNK